MSLLKQIFTWWNGQTIGTMVWTNRHGVRVGEDDEGNIYYRNAEDTRRWVIYSGESEASRVSPDWHGWLHGTFDLPPTEAPLPRRTWEKDHVPNLTGSAGAYRPPGSVLSPESRPRNKNDYDAWTPE